MSWLFSLALAEEFSLVASSVGERSARLSGTSSPQASLPQDRTMGTSRHSPYGATFAPLTVGRGAELLMWYLAGFRVKPIPLRLREETLRTISGRKCGGWWQMSLQGTYLPRTSNDARSIGRPTTSKRWVTPSSVYRCPRQTWVLTTFGPGIGYLHTPTRTANYCAPSMQKHACARAFRAVFGRPSPSAHEWLMGWPMGWTQLGRQATVKFQEWLRSHSSLSQKALVEEAA